MAAQPTWVAQNLLLMHSAEWLNLSGWAEAGYYSHEQSTTIPHHLFIASTVWGQCFNFDRPVLKLRMFVEKNPNIYPPEHELNKENNG